MEAFKKPTRRCSRSRKPKKSQRNRGDRQICLAMTREVYDQIWAHPQAVRAWIDAQLQKSPELFPASMKGYHLSGRLRASRKMPGIRLRQLRLANKEVYTLRPSFVMPFMTGLTEQLKFPLLLLAWGMPSWLIAMGFGRNANYWDRHLERLGRNSLAGTTVRDRNRLPKDLTVDEHHAPWGGKKGFITMTVGEGCILGTALTKATDDAHLAEAYGEFALEARDVDPQYAPRTVNTDGWQSTQNAWRGLFPSTPGIRCFLHGFLKIRERCNKDYGLHGRVWEIYRAPTKEEFRLRMSAFQEWAASQDLPASVQKAITKFCKRVDEYTAAYDYPGCRRTSNMVDRLMNRLYRVLYAHRGLHGHQASSELRLRGWSLLMNFRPFAPRAGRPRACTSPAHRLNGQSYHDCWLQNLLLSASLGGRRCHT